jgi:hypothetical protein
MVKIFLDDMRPCPNGFILAKNYKECITLLKNNKVDVISLDHDLGGNKSGYDVVKYMVEYDIYPSTIILHSANPVGVQNMEQLLKRYVPSHVTVIRNIWR